MSAAEYLKSTPPEINIKAEAWNDARRWDARRDYNFAVLLLNGRNDPKKFPTFERFYPEEELVQEKPEPKQKEMTNEEARRDLLSLKP